MRNKINCLVAGALCVAVSGAALAQTAADPVGRANATLDEVVVTAQKRSEPLLQVPVPVTSISADSLIEKNQVQLQDYFREVPSVSLNSTGDGQNTLAIRGVVTSDLSNPTVGVTIDDIPYGSSSAYGYGSLLLPDLDPADLKQVEVLRGPQGTLYGASSLGGLLKFATTDPSLTAMTGRAQVDLNSVDHGGDGYGVRGSVSLPLIADQLAFSVSGFKRRDPGFIDDPGQGRRDVNRVDVKGGRVAVLWKPSDAISLKLSALGQDTHGNGTNSIDSNAQLQPTPGDLQQSVQRGTGSYDLRIRLYTGVLTAQLGRFQLVSLTGYGVNEYVAPLQFQNGFFSGLAQTNFGVSGNTLVNSFRTEKFSQEFRLASPTGETLEWLVGAFYTHEKTPVSQIINAADPATGATAGTLIDFSFPTTYEEYAVFSDLTAHFTDRFDVQFGGRESENRQTYNESDFGVVAPLLFGTDPFTFPAQSTKANAFTYLVTPRFKVSPTLMLYARFASGYRPGGNNGEATAFNLPLTFKPDKTFNYEVGMKGTLLDDTLSFDTSVYYIDWKDVQLSQTDPVSGLSYFTNGGKARSEGVELSVKARPFKALTIDATAAFNNAELKQDLPLTAGVGFSGDRLPFSARFAGSLSANEDIFLTDRLTGFVGTTIAYTGNRFGAFVNPISTNPLVPGNRSELPAYTTMDLRTGVRRDAWRIALFVDNVGDKRGILSAASRITGSASYTDPYGFTVIRPRTYGMSISVNF